MISHPWYIQRYEKSGGGETNDGDRFTYVQGHDGNLFTQAFLNGLMMVPKEDLQELRVTGGESPSSQFWKLVDKCEGEKFNFAINRIHNSEDNMMDKLIDASKKFKHLTCITL